MPDTQPAFIVIAEFSVTPEHRAEFLDLCIFDSVRSTTDEPTCRQFNVHTSEDSPDLVILYEVYDSRAAFDHHMATPHFATFAAGLERLGITTVAVRFFTRHHP